MTQVADKLAHLQFLNNREQPEVFLLPLVAPSPAKVTHWKNVWFVNHEGEVTQTFSRQVHFESHSP